MNNTLHIMNDLGNFFTIDLTTGYINGHSRWIFRGLRHVKSSDTFVDRSEINDGWLIGMSLTNEIFFNNNKCQWRVCDIDHGTFREWGNGIRRIWITE